MSVLGRDFGDVAMSRFSGRLLPATLTHKALGALSSGDPAGAPAATTTSHSCEGVSFRLSERYIDGERVTKRDFVVSLLRGSINAGATMPQVGDTVSITPPGGAGAVVAHVEQVIAISDSFVTLRVRGPAA